MSRKWLYVLAAVFLSGVFFWTNDAEMAAHLGLLSLGSGVLFLGYVVSTGIRAKRLRRGEAEEPDAVDIHRIHVAILTALILIGVVGIEIAIRKVGGLWGIRSCSFPILFWSVLRRPRSSLRVSARLAFMTGGGTATRPTHSLFFSRRLLCRGPFSYWNSSPSRGGCRSHTLKRRRVMVMRKFFLCVAGTSRLQQGSLASFFPGCPQRRSFSWRAGVMRGGRRGSMRRFSAVSGSVLS